MANVQLAVAGDETTQVILSVPGVQGPAGSNLPPSGTTHQLLYKQSNTDYDTAWKLITNDNVDAAAAIAGTKISPNFGSQNVLTTGTSTAASFIPSSSSVPTNGIYLPAANSVALSTNGTGRLFVDASGRVGIGTASPAAPFDCSIGDRGLQVSAVTASHVQLTGTQGSTSSNLRPMRLAAQTLSFNTGASTGTSYTERVFIDTNGNIGIGTPNATANIHVLSSSGTEVRVACSIVDSHLNFWEGNGVSGNADTTRLGVGKNNTALIYTNSTGTARAAFAIGTTGPEPLVLSTNNTERLRITSAGLVGIGTSSPGYKLDVNGEVAFSPNTAGKNTFYFTTNASNDASLLLKSDTTNKVNIQANGPSYFNGGSVGIGTTSPGSLLSVGQTTAQTGVTLPTAFSISRSDSTTSLLSFGPHEAAQAAPSPGAVITSNNRGFIISNNTPDLSGTQTEGLFLDRVNSALAFYRGGERARIDSSGRLLVGTSTARSVGSGSQATVQVETTSYVAFSGVNNTNDTGGCTLNLGKSRGTAVGSATSVLANDTLGTINFAGADGTDVVSVGAQIQAQVDGTPGANDMPGRLVFSVTADGASSPTEAMRIKNSRILNFANTPTYADNTAAKAGGLVDGDVYRKSDGTLMIVYT